MWQTTDLTVFDNSLLVFDNAYCSDPPVEPEDTIIPLSYKGRANPFGHSANQQIGLNTTTRSRYRIQAAQIRISSVWILSFSLNYVLLYLYYIGNEMGRHRNRNGNYQGGVDSAQNSNNIGWGGSNLSNNNSNSGGQKCKYCGKTNHISDRCFFKNKQPNQNGNYTQNHNMNAQDLNQQNTKFKHNPKKSCTYCGKKGHTEADCYQRKNGDQQNNKQPRNPHQFCTFCQKQGHLEDNCGKKNGSQSYNPNEYCTLCKQQGHIELFCTNKAPQKKKDNLSRSRNEKGLSKRPVQGNTAYELPLGIVRREIVTDRGFSHGVEWVVRGHEYFITDVENDVLMCDCDGISAGCLSACAHNLFSQKGTVLISKEDRRTLEKGMWANRCTRLEDTTYGQHGKGF